MKQLSKISTGILLVALIAAGSFVAGMAYYANVYAANPAPLVVNQPTAPSVENTPIEFSTFWEAWSFLDKEFYGEIPPDDERIYGAIRGMVTSFGDQHTGFIDPVRAQVFREDIHGSFEGIGATIRLDEFGRLMIVDPMPGRPAFEAGLHPGDIILEVDGQSIEGLSLYEDVLLIRGPAGSAVVLTVFREGESEPFDVSIKRATIELEIVVSQLLDGNIGYVRLTQFSKGAAGTLADATATLLDQGATTLIFDLRSNPGGLLSEAVDVSALFIEEGPVVIERLKGGEEKRFDARLSRHVALDTPLVVLTNSGSASASEIVAGAMQDYERGTVIGQQTFGKGSVQLPHTLSDGSELRVTVAEWLTPLGRQIHGEGITPDIEVDMTVEDLQAERDPQLDEAIKFLREQQAN